MPLETSILKSVKDTLNVAATVDVFDQVILVHINSAFSRLNELGVGPADGFMIEGEDETWEDFGTSVVQTNTVKTYMYLYVRSMFDPPPTSFLIAAQKDQLEKFEFSLTKQATWEADPVDPMEEV